METERFALKFDDTGKPQVLNLADGTPLLTADDPGDGFVLKCEGSTPRSVRLERPVPQAGGRLLATTGDGAQGVVFEVKETTKYVAFRIVELRGIDTQVFERLDFSLNATPDVRVMELDYMTTTGAHDDGVSVSWPYLKHSGAHNPYGGFALYVARDPDDEDDTILRIWVNEGLPHPRVEGPWDLAAARGLIAEWQEKYADQSQFYLEAKTPEDLYAGVKYAERAGVKDIYLFTNTWHADRGFWPRASLNWAVNTEVFPRGEADLRAFSDHLAGKGMNLKIHWVSGGIPLGDPRYIVPGPDRRLATWVTGQLVESADTEATTLKFRPDSTPEQPKTRGGGPPPFVRIDDELIRVGSFGDTNAEIWQLSGCQRGVSETPVSAHPAGAKLAGLVSPYNAVFTPDVDSDLLDEMAEGFAGLLNRCRIMNVEFDGYEVHAYAGRWGSEKFAAKVYAALDHTVASNTSGGRPPRCWIEYRLNSSKHLMRGNTANTHGGYSAAVILDSPSRPASRVIEAHFSMSKAAANDSNRFSVTRPEPMFGVSPSVIEEHGRSGEILDVVRQWKQASMSMTDEQHRRMRSTFEPATRRLRDGSRDPASEIVWVLRDTPQAWRIVPVRVLTREEGDIKWHSWQEHGPIMPRQYVRAGQPLRLINPNPAQSPSFTLRCLSALDAEEPTGNATATALEGLAWVWDTAGADTAPNSTPAATVYLRRTFDLPAAFHQGTARFAFAVDDELELWVNGTPVGKGGTFTQMTVWDITPHLQAGRNVIAIAATSFAGPAGLAGKIEVLPARTAAEQREAERVAAFEGKTDISAFELPIDATWRCTTAPPKGWQQPDFDAAGWASAVRLVEVGGEPWGELGDAVVGSIALQPVSDDMKETGDMQFTDTEDGMRITGENTAAERRTFEDALPFFMHQADMSAHRGIGMTVTGDGSGALLVVGIPGRDYVVPIDFSGTRYIEIPNGEVSWADGRWGWRVSTHRANYGRVSRVRLGFGALPGKTRASIVVHNLRALREIPTQLQDPVVRIGQGTLRCTGAVQTGEYLQYTGGKTARVYDRNWNLLRELPVDSRDFVMPTGEESVTILGADGVPIPWLDVQIMTEGTPLVVPKPETVAPPPPRYSGLRQ